jgi:hypothetical protein
VLGTRLSFSVANCGKRAGVSAAVSPKTPESLGFWGVVGHGTANETAPAAVFHVEEVTVPSVSQQSTPPFASLSSTPRQGSGFAQFFLAPFRDVDDRVARLLAAAKTEREARQAAMSPVGEPHR